MKKSTTFDLQQYAAALNDDEYSDTMFEEVDLSGISNSDDIDSYNDNQPFDRSIESQLGKFTQQNEDVIGSTQLPAFEVEDFNLGALNTPFLPKAAPSLIPVECSFLMSASCEHFQKPESEDLKDRSTIFMWKDMNSIMPLEFSNHITQYFKDKYAAIRPRIRFFNQIEPTIDKLNNVSTIRRDIPNGRILFHYLGYGFPTIEAANIYAIDKKTGQFASYPFHLLINNIKTPSCFIFDCNNAAVSISAIKNAHLHRKADKEPKSFREQFVSRNLDWNDWFCVCATDVGETLPSDPHLPRDFLSSCILTPVYFALVCHILQYYRTSMVTKNFPLDRKNCAILDTESIQFKQLDHWLHAILDSIAVESIETSVYHKLFRKDPVIKAVFTGFLLSQYLLRPYQVHPVASPFIPDLSTHPLWQHWKTAVDLSIASLMLPTVCIQSNIFSRTLESVKGYLQRGEVSIIPVSYIMLLFHMIEMENSDHKVYKVLAHYASKSQRERKILAKTALFSKLFNVLLNVKLKETCLHSLLYLIVSLLQTHSPFVHEIPKEEDLSHFYLHLLDNSLKPQTRTLVAAILATLVSVNEGVRSSIITTTFLKSIRTILETSDTSLTLWCLLILRRMFDSYGVELPDIYRLGLHIQVASLCYHKAPEVRAASLATLSCYLCRTEHVINSQLFGLSVLSIFDSSYTVRFNYVLFLSHLLMIYQDKLTGKTKRKVDPHQLFKSIIGQWFNSEEASYAEMTSNFKTLVSIIDKFCAQPDAISCVISISLTIISLLKDDPHPSVRSTVAELKKLVLSSQEVESDNSDFEFNDDKTPISESGGDCLYRICMRQLVRSGCWKLIKEEKSRSGSFKTLFQSTISELPRTRLTAKLRLRIEGERATHVAYHETTLSLAAATNGGRVIYEHEKYKKRYMIKCRDNITGLAVTDWEFEPLVIFGTESGWLNIWKPGSSSLRNTFCIELPAYADHMPLVFSAVKAKPQIITARGDCGAIRLWDIECERAVGEWTASGNYPITALAAHPTDPNSCAAGFQNGRLVMMDLRCSDGRSLFNIVAPKINQSIISIAGNVGPRTSFFASTYEGSCFTWETLEDIKIIKEEGETLSAFDAHLHSPMLVYAPTNSHPYMTDTYGKILHQLRSAGPGATCSFHPILPVVTFGTTAGELIEYELISDI